MPEDNTLSELQALDAVAAEKGMVLAFRVCDESGDLEPVYLSIHSAEAGGENEAALIAIGDARGMSLGRYVIPRSRLQAALAEAEDVENIDAEPTAVPLDWQQA
jgi:hypothetical protein